MRCLLQKRFWQNPQSPVMACAAALQGGWAQRGFLRTAVVVVGIDAPEGVVPVVVRQFEPFLSYPNGVCSFCIPASFDLYTIPLRVRAMIVSSSPQGKFVACFKLLRTAFFPTRVIWHRVLIPIQSNIQTAEFAPVVSKNSTPFHPIHACYLNLRSWQTTLS